MVILANALFSFFNLNLEHGELGFRFNIKVIGFFVAVVELLLKCSGEDDGFILEAYGIKLRHNVFFLSFLEIVSFGFVSLSLLIL